MIDNEIILAYNYVLDLKKFCILFSNDGSSKWPLQQRHAPLIEEERVGSEFFFVLI